MIGPFRGEYFFLSNFYARPRLTMPISDVTKWLLIPPALVCLVFVILGAIVWIGAKILFCKCIGHRYEDRWQPMPNTTRKGLYSHCTRCGDFFLWVDN